MSTAAQRAQWAFDTEYRARQLREQEFWAMHAVIDDLHREIAAWRDLCTELIRNGATLPPQEES